MSDDKLTKMDRLANCWKWMSGVMRDRPVQLTLYAVGVVLLAIALTASLVKSHNNEVNIGAIKSVLCAQVPGQSPADRTRDCQRLLDELLRNPTPEQARRLRQIIKDGE